MPRPFTKACTTASQTFTSACSIVRMHERMHERTHACMGRCMHARARDTTSPMHARKGKNPSGKWMPRLWPVPLVWRPLFAQRRSRNGKLLSRNEAGLNPEVLHQTQWADSFGLETGFPPKTVEILALFQAPVTGATCRRVWPARQQGGATKMQKPGKMLDTILQTCMHTGAGTPQAHPCIQ